MSARATNSKRAGAPRGRVGKNNTSTPSAPLESTSPIASLPPSEDSLGERALEEDNSELADASVASTGARVEEPATPSSTQTRKLEAAAEPSTPVSLASTDERERPSTGDPSTKIRIPYSKLRSSGVLQSPLFQSPEAFATPGAAAADGKLRIQYSRPGQPERSGSLRLDFPDLSDYPALTRALSTVGKGEQYGTVAKREVEALRDEFERIRVELRSYDLEARRELDVMADTRAAPGLPDPRSSPALQRRRTEDLKPLRQSSSSVVSASSVVDPNKKRLKKLSARGREEDEDESIDVQDVDGKMRNKRDRKRDKDKEMEVPAAAAGGASGESKKYNLKARSKDKKSKGKKGDDEDGEAESADDGESLDAANLPTTAGGPSNPFWAFVHQFIRDFVEEDLLMLKARELRPDDAVFVIPPLGRHWTEFRKPKAEDQDGAFGEQEVEQQPVHCGDLTQRILASLIEERLLPDDRPPATDAAVPVPAAQPSLPSQATVAPSSAAPSSASTLSAAAASAPAPAAPIVCIPAITNGTASLSSAATQLDSTAFEFPETEAALPLSSAPTGDYSFATMLSLEERIKMELKSLGLFDPEENPQNPAQEKEEDNEIVQEIRSLQAQLKEQVAKNNTARERIFELALSRLGDQKKDKDVRGTHAELEKAYIRVVQRRKPKRKKGPGRKGG